MRRALCWSALIAFVVVLLLGLVARLLPDATTQRAILVSTPSLPGLFDRQELALQANARTCVAPVALDPSARNVQLLAVLAPGAPDPKLRALVTAPGYRSLTPLADPGVRGEDERLVAQLASPPPTVADAQLCVVSGARPRTSLVGTVEPRSLTPAQTTVNGKPAPMHAAVWVYAEGSGSLLDRVSSVADHAAAFAPNPFGKVALLILGLLVVLLVPGLVGWTIVSSLRRDEPDDRDDEPDRDRDPGA